jgi:hypothetical protein
MSSLSINKNMLFTLEQRYKILNFLNFSLIRSYELQSQYMDFGGEMWHVNAKLNPTEYQANRPQPLLFEESDIWTRIDSIEQQSCFLVSEVVQIINQLQEIQAELHKLLSSANYAIKKADVLEYDIDKKSEGLNFRSHELTERLRYFLKLPPTPTIGGCNTPFYRS